MALRTSDDPFLGDSFMTPISRLSARRATSGRRALGMLAALPFVAAAALQGGTADAATAATPYLHVSTSTDRSGAALLDGQTLSGKVYVFVPVVAGGTTASFWIDDASAGS